MPLTWWHCAFLPFAPTRLHRQDTIDIERTLATESTPASSKVNIKDSRVEIRVSIAFASGYELTKLRNLHETEPDEFQRYGGEISRKLGFSQPPMNGVIWVERPLPTLLLRWRYESVDTVCPYRIAPFQYLNA